MHSNHFIFHEPCLGRKEFSKIALLAALALPLLLCACVTDPVGDFGRKDEPVFHDTILGGTGSIAALSRKGPASSFPMTDEESELRNVAWDLVRPPGGGASWNDDYVFSMRWARIAPADWYEADTNDFYILMRNSGLASHETYYELLINQARSDASKLPLFRDAATRVGKADAARRGALGALYADEAMRHEAEVRIAENAHVVRWVEESMQYRIRAYRTALGRLMVEVPSVKAVEAESAIDALQWEVNGSLSGARPRIYAKEFKEGRPFRPHTGKRRAKD
jgi:hypothetical protein